MDIVITPTLTTTAITIAAATTTNLTGTILAQHQSGCHCKKSACLKKYCECFQAAVACHDRCRCQDCQNTSEHRALRANGNRGQIIQNNVAPAPQPIKLKNEIGVLTSNGWKYPTPDPNPISQSQKDFMNQFSIKKDQPSNARPFQPPKLFTNIPPTTSTFSLTTPNNQNNNNSNTTTTSTIPTSTPSFSSFTHSSNSNSNSTIPMSMPSSLSSTTTSISTNTTGIDDKPIYNKAQAEQAALDIVCAFLRGQIVVPGLSPASFLPNPALGKDLPEILKQLVPGIINIIIFLILIYQSQFIFLNVFFILGCFVPSQEKSIDNTSTQSTAANVDTIPSIPFS